MPKFTKKTFSRKRTGKFTKRTARKPRTMFKRGGPVKLADPTVVKLNPGKDPIIRIKKSLKEISPFASGVSGTNGMFIGSQTTTATVAYQLLFDPAGALGNNSTTFISGLTTQGAAQIPEWLSYAALYDMYKVTKVTARFTALDVGNLDVGSPVMYIRYNTKYNAAVPNTNDLANKRGWIKKTFTDAQRDFSYSFYPKTMSYVDNAATLATDSRVPKTMSWTNCSTPAEIYGLQMLMVMPGSAVGYSINCNFEYHLQFKVSN